MTSAEPPDDARRPAANGPADRRPQLRFGKYRMSLPRSRALRTAIGGLFVLMGLFGFLPVLGFWMVPAGLLVLSVDFPVARRLNRRMTVWLHRKFPRFMQKVSGTG